MASTALSTTSNCRRHRGPAPSSTKSAGPTDPPLEHREQLAAARAERGDRLLPHVGVELLLQLAGQPAQALLDQASSTASESSRLPPRTQLALGRPAAVASEGA